MSGLKIDYDSHWKEIIGEFFEDFTAFFMPDLHKDVDFTRPVEFLEQELLDAFKTKYKGKRITDKLVKMYLKDGAEKWLLVHIEVQASFDKEFAERMFLYYTMIYTKYLIKDITAIAIFANDSIPKKDNKFEHKLYGTKISYEYNVYRIIDQKPEKLIKSKNPFAYAVLANLYVLRTNQNYDERLAYKEMLFEIAKKLGYDEKKRIRLLIFVRNLMVLPNELESQFATRINRSIHNKKNMKLNKGDRKLLEMMCEALSGETMPERELRLQREFNERAESLAKKMAKSLAGEMAESLANERAESLAKEMAKRLAAEMAGEMAERLVAEKTAKAKMSEKQRTIIRYYEKRQFEGLAEFCELIDADYLFAETTITEYLQGKNTPSLPRS